MRREGVKNGETFQKIKRLLAEGSSAMQIARELGISRQAVYPHIDKINGKDKRSQKGEGNRWGKVEKKKYLIDWKIYNDALVMRGEFIFCFDLFEIEKQMLEQMNLGKKGKNYKYSDTLMDVCRIMKASFKLDFRTLEGIGRKLFPLFGLKAADYSTICKRLDSLGAELKEFCESEEKEIAADGSGRSQNKRGYYRESKYDVKSRSYVRVSVSVDVKTKEATAVKVTTQKESEIPAVKEVVERTEQKSKVKKVYADKLHDSKGFRGELIARRIEPVIPARETVSIEQARSRCKNIEDNIIVGNDMRCYDILGEYQRLKTLIDMSVDYDKWRDENNYGKRSMVENFFSRDTLIFSDSVSSKKLSKADKEIKARYTMLNIFMTLSRSKSREEMKFLCKDIKDRIVKEGGIAVKLNHIYN